MKTHLLAIAAAAGVLLATSPSSATPLAPTSAAPIGVERIDSAVESIHYRHRSVRRHGFRHHSLPVFTFGFAPAVTPYYAHPYPYSYYPYHPYTYTYAHPRAYTYGVGPSLSFGFHIR